MSGKALRSALEPLKPALAGIGLAHVLFGVVVWHLLPWVASEDAPDAEAQQAELVWRAPADFKEVVPEQVKPEAPSEAKGKNPGRQGEVIPPEVRKTAPKPQTVPEVTVPKARLPTTQVATGLHDSISSATGMDLLLLRPMAGGLSSQIGDGLDGGGRGGREHGSSVHLEAPSSTPPEKTRPLREPAKYMAFSAITKAAAPAVAAVPQAVPSLLQVAVHNEADRLLAAETGGADMGGVEKALQQAMMEAWKPPSPTIVPADRRRVEVRLAVLRDGAIRDAVIHRESGSKELDDSVRQMLEKVSKISESLPAKFPGTRYSLQVNLQID